MEFPASGGVVPSYTFRTTKLIRYVTALDYFIMACEIMYIIFIVYYGIEEIIEVDNVVLRKTRKKNLF
jgi:polycystin 2